jgi:hypothetical protein
MKLDGFLICHFIETKISLKIKDRLKICPTSKRADFGPLQKMRKIMKKFFLFAALAAGLSISAGCPEMTEKKPEQVASKPAPPPPGVSQEVYDDQSTPVEEVDPKQFAAEQAAADELNKMGFLVMREGEDKVITSVNFLGNHRKIDKKITDLLPALFRVGTINLDDTEFGDEQLNALQNKHKLVSLLLNGTQVSDAGMPKIGTFENLVSLFLMHTNITDNGLSPLANLSKLAILDVSYNKITDRGLAEIAKCQNVNHLLISGTEITDEGLQQLVNMPHLGRLTLLDAKTTEQGIATLKASKPGLAVDVNSSK